MRDPKDAAIELLDNRGHRDAARVLERCKITLRQLERKPTRLGEGPPLAEMLIHAPTELATVVLGSANPVESQWSGQIEQALRDAAERDDVALLVIQWVETGKDRPQTVKPPPRRSSGETPGRGAGQ
jgi:hypothetical protein